MGPCLFDEGGELRRIAGTVRDLSEERALQGRMQLSLELLEEAQTMPILVRKRRAGLTRASWREEAVARWRSAPARLHATR